MHQPRTRIPTSRHGGGTEARARAGGHVRGGPAGRLLTLQRAAGNAAVSGALASAGGPGTTLRIPERTGHRPAPAASRGTPVRPVQRVVAQISVTPGKKHGVSTITDVNIQGRPRSPHSGTMGDHTTAYVVQVTAVRNAVVGKSPRNALAAIKKLHGDVTTLPGYQRREALANGHAEHFELLRAAEKLLLTLMKSHSAGDVLGLQKVIVAFLDFRELVPLTTLNIKEISPALAGKGKAESGPHEVLTARKHRTPEELRKAIIGLLDVKSLAILIAEGRPEVAAKVAPGLGPGDRMRPIVAQHLTSIEQAYPGAVLKAWGTDDPKKALAAAVTPAVEIRKKKNIDFHNERLLAAYTRKTEVENELAVVPQGAKARQAKLAMDLQDARGAIVDAKARVTESGGTPKEEPPLGVEPPPATTVAPPAGRGRKRKLPAENPTRRSTRAKSAPTRMDYGPPATSGKKRRRSQASKPPANTATRRKLVVRGRHKKHKPNPDASAAKRTATTTTTTPIPATVTVPKPAAAIDAATGQKPRVATQIILDGDKISDVLIAGRPRSALPSGRMGAHTTAWIVHNDVVRTALIGCTIDQAATKLPRLGEDADAMARRLHRFGGSATISGDMRKAAKRVEGTVLKLRPLALQDAINTLLTRINAIPGVALDVAETDGDHEGPHRRMLLEYERKRAPATPTELREAILRLLDVKSVDDYENLKALVDNHRKLVEAAYPKSYRASGLKGMKLRKVVKLIRSDVAPPSAKRRKV